MLTVKCPQCSHKFPVQEGRDRVVPHLLYPRGQKECPYCRRMVGVSARGNRVRHPCVRRGKPADRVEVGHSPCPWCGKHVKLTVAGRVWRHRSKNPIESTCNGSGMDPKQEKRRVL